ncbi:hypothetical protein JHW43_008749 [Diplocarpon mali]|nr:hypothetical protein JHW43_008749 [Diplocarpon mali]
MNMAQYADARSWARVFLDQIHASMWQRCGTSIAHEHETLCRSWRTRHGRDAWACSAAQAHHRQGDNLGRAVKKKICLTASHGWVRLHRPVREMSTLLADRPATHQFTTRQYSSNAGMLPRRTAARAYTPCSKSLGGTRQVDAGQAWPGIPWHIDKKPRHPPSIPHSPRSDLTIETGLLLHLLPLPAQQCPAAAMPGLHLQMARYLADRSLVLPAREHQTVGKFSPQPPLCMSGPHAYEGESCSGGGAKQKLINGSYLLEHKQAGNCTRVLTRSREADGPQPCCERFAQLQSANRAPRQEENFLWVPGNGKSTTRLRRGVPRFAIEQNGLARAPAAEISVLVAADPRRRGWRLSGKRPLFSQCVDVLAGVLDSCLHLAIPPTEAESSRSGSAMKA